MNMNISIFRTYLFLHLLPGAVCVCVCVVYFDRGLMSSDYNNSQLYGDTCTRVMWLWPSQGEWSIAARENVISQ